MLTIRLTAVILLTIILLSRNTFSGKPTDTDMTPITIATCATDKDDLYWALVMTESLREFGGKLSQTPVTIYLYEDNPELDTLYLGYRKSLRIVVRHFRAPDAMRQVIYSQKVYAAALAEDEADQVSDILVWLDPDVIFVKEPSEFMLEPDKALGYRPVQLLNISSRFDQPPNQFWTRLFALLDVPDSAIFPMTTTTDLVEIRPHFNAGMMIVRPERGILQSWPVALEKLWSDSTIRALCSEDRKHAIFLHQTALAGAILSKVPHDQMKDLPPTYNFAAVFADRLPIERRAKSLDDLVMFRHDLRLSDPAIRDKIADTSRIWQWLTMRLPR